MRVSVGMWGEGECEGEKRHKISKMVCLLLNASLNFGFHVHVDRPRVQFRR